MSYMSYLFIYLFLLAHFWKKILVKKYYYNVFQRVITFCAALGGKFIPGGKFNFVSAHDVSSRAWANYIWQSRLDNSFLRRKNLLARSCQCIRYILYMLFFFFFPQYWLCISNIAWIYISINNNKILIKNNNKIMTLYITDHHSN